MLYFWLDLCLMYKDKSDENWKMWIAQNFCFMQKKVTSLFFNVVPLLCNVFALSVKQYLSSSKTEPFVLNVQPTVHGILCVLVKDDQHHVNLCLVVDLNLAHSLTTAHCRYFMMIVWRVRLLMDKNQVTEYAFFLGICQQCSHPLDIHCSLLADYWCWCCLLTDDLGADRCCY